MNNSQIFFTSISIEKCNELGIAKVIKNFVDWFDGIYTY